MLRFSNDPSLKYIMAQKFVVCNFVFMYLFKSFRKSKNINILKYYYNLNGTFSIWIYFKL